MFRRTSKLRKNSAVMYKSVDDLILKNKKLIGSTRFSNLPKPAKDYFIRC